MMSKLRLFVLVVCIQIIVVGAIYGISEASQPTPPDPEKTTEGEPREPVSNSLSSPGEELELTEAAAPDVEYFFHRIAGVNFRPRDSDTEYEYGFDGCMYRSASGGDKYFYADVQIPDGAEIDYLRVYYYDDSIDYDAAAWIWSFDGLGGNTSIASATGSDTPGYDSAGSGSFSYFVDSVNEALVVTAYLPSSDDTLMFCGVRLKYQCSPPSCTYLPACFR